jgi:sugar-phosphatase
VTIAIECDAVVFDLDGVLVDSGRTVVAAWQRLCDEFGIELAALGPLHGVRTVDALPADLPPNVAAEAERRLEVLEIEMSAAARPVPGALRLLAALPPGRWGIATSGSMALATARLQAAGIPRPAVMITADDVTAGKPDPAPYVAATGALGVDGSRAVVFEDAPSGAAAALAAGTTVVAVATTHDLGAFPAAVWINDLRDVEVVAAEPLTIQVARQAAGEHTMPR